MMPYEDETRARAAAADDHRRALGMPGPAPGPSGLLEPATDADGRLPSKGRHFDEGIRLLPSESYQGEFDLHFDAAGNGSLRVGLDVGDLAALRAALPNGRRPVTAAEVREFLRGLHDSCEAAKPTAGNAHEAHRNLSAIVRVLALLEG
jgi:hypothetical protein